jgi:hypothetical protein
MWLLDSTRTREDMVIVKHKVKANGNCSTNSCLLLLCYTTTMSSPALAESSNHTSHPRPDMTISNKGSCKQNQVT